MSLRYQRPDRQAIEKRIATAVIKSVLAADNSIAVDDGEEMSAPRVNLPEVLEDMFSTDTDRLHVYDKDGRGNGWIDFVYGNDGVDVISDYTVNLEEVLKPARDLADLIEKGLTKWVIYIPEEGHWPIEYDGDDPKEAKRIYLKWAGQRRLPANAFIARGDQ